MQKPLHADAWANRALHRRPGDGSGSAGRLPMAKWASVTVPVVGVRLRVPLTGRMTHRDVVNTGSGRRH